MFWDILTSTGEEHTQRRLHSVVKERHEASDEEGQPTRTYYQYVLYY